MVYKVNANNYSSTVSQDDADQMALNEVTTNGQEYANIHGTCPISTTKVILKKLSSVGAVTGNIVNNATNESFDISALSSPAATTSTGYVLTGIPIGNYTLNITPILNSVPQGTHFNFNINGTNKTSNSPFSMSVNIQSEFTITLNAY